MAADCPEDEECPSGSSDRPIGQPDRAQIAHLVGACGAGMKALAELLLDRNWILTGSDLLRSNSSIQKLVQRGLVLHQGHASSNLPTAAEVLIYSPAIPTSNVERMEAFRRRMPQLTYSQMVGRLMSQSTGVCIAGTHGKSTTTAMTAWILHVANRLSGVAMGAELCETGRSGWSGSGDLFVAESCEFQRSFLDFDPRFSVILGIEPDHFDCYPDTKALQAAFVGFANRTADEGVLMVNGDCSVSRNVVEIATTKARRVTFACDSVADWSATQIAWTKRGMQFQLNRSKGRESIAHVELPLPGRHNVQNALAAAVVCLEAGVSADLVCEALSTFRGIRRRCEFVDDVDGVTWVDDYAHHPTAVQATLSTLRQMVGRRKLYCVFQPHQILRTTKLMDDYASSFAAADQVLVAPVFAARESAADQPVQVSGQLAERIALQGVPAKSFASLDQIASTLEYSVRSGDVIVTMGAGDIDRIYHEWTRSIQRNTAAG